MISSFAILYHERVVHEDIPRIPKNWRDNIRRVIEERLMTQPDLYSKPLRRSLKGYRKLRVGDYRVIFRINEQAIMILIIQHRSVVYDEVSHRISDDKK